MGYKYAIWLVYDDNICDSKSESQHIGHFTIACMLDIEEAMSLYNDLIHHMDHNKKTDMHVMHFPQVFDTTFYKNDTNNLYAWGYQAYHPDWDTFRYISQRYQGSFSYTPHTSIQYSKKTFNKETQPLAIREKVTCTLHIANATSDNPKDWFIIQ